MCIYRRQSVTSFTDVIYCLHLMTSFTDITIKCCHSNQTMPLALTYQCLLNYRHVDLWHKHYCQSLFYNLCTGSPSWNYKDGMFSSQTSSPSVSSESARSALSSATASASINSFSHDPLPYSVGLDENHPHACNSCEKAFSKLSYLKKHQQVGF